jgi:hypothetical protein
MDSTPPWKDTILQTELKRKIQQSVVYKRPTVLTEINTGLIIFTQLMAPENRQG